MQVKAVCVKCKRVFLKRSPVQKYCSSCIDDAKCRGVSLNLCRGCGKIFELKKLPSGGDYRRPLCKECRNKDKPKYVCAHCGKLFAKRTLGQNFCDDCIAEGKAGGWSYHKCKQCGTVFTAPRRLDGREKSPPYCEECYWIHRERVNENRRKRRAKKREELTEIMTQKRRCHDCGKPTYNYRCAECQAKWRQENDVVSEYDSRRRANQETYNIYI